MTTNLQNIRDELRKFSDAKIAEHSQRFFKTGKGEYGEGDKFLGIRVPVLRKLAKKYKNISLDEIVELLKSPFHEERLLAVFMLVNAFKKSSDEVRKNIYEIYLANTEFINNWDIVDSSAHFIVGAYLRNRDKKSLYTLAKSENLWERRIAIIATFHFIKNNEFADALKISRILLTDEEDLIHKAVGWMLREIGNRNIETEEKFLKKHYKKMPRTMLRYAIEKFPEEKRQKYLKNILL